MSETVISADSLTKRFTSGVFRKRSVEAVKDLTLEIKRGEIFAFLGPNGAGKTTTINLLMGFLKPTRGAVSVFGLPAGAVEARRRIGYLPENYAFYNFFTAPTLLDYFGQLFHIPAKERRTKIEKLLHQLDLWQARNLAIGKYSRGMRQRLGIIQALMNDPELLILDEPTSGFDPHGRKMVRELLLQRKAEGATILLSSHILSEVEAICDRVAIVDRGRLIKLGNLSDLIGAHIGYEIKFCGVEPRIAGDLQSLGLKVQLVGDQFQTFTGDEQLGQRVVDVVRANGGLLKAYVPITRTLEDVFLELTGDREEA